MSDGLDFDPLKDVASASAAAAAASLKPQMADQLLQRTASCLGRSIPWDGYCRASLLSDSELKLVKKLDSLFKQNVVLVTAASLDGGDDAGRSSRRRSSATGSGSGSSSKEAVIAVDSAGVRRTLLELDEDERGELLNAYVELFLALLSKINKEETLQYLLCLMSELVSPPVMPLPQLGADVDEDTIAAETTKAVQAKAAAEEFRLDVVRRFLNTGSASGAPAGWPFEPLTRILARGQSDWFTNCKASSVVSELLLVQAAGARFGHVSITATADVSGTAGAGGASAAAAGAGAGAGAVGEVDASVVRAMSDWFVEQLRKSSEKDVAAAVHVLMRYCRADAFRESVARDGLQLLTGLLETRMKKAQLVYEVLHVVWLLSYSTAAQAMMARGARIVATLITVMKEIPKEKVVRMATGTLRNLCTGVDKTVSAECVQQMLDYGVSRPLDQLAARQWGDEDIVEDIDDLRERIATNSVELSTFDLYKKEVLSGKLEWSLVHKSEKFWRDNAHRLEEDKYKLLFVLKELLNAKDPSVREIACFDVGEFARFHPRGRALVNDLGIKIVLMSKMMEDDDIHVQGAALAATQKLMVNKIAVNV